MLAATTLAQSTTTVLDFSASHTNVDFTIEEALLTTTKDLLGIPDVVEAEAGNQEKSSELGLSGIVGLAVAGSIAAIIVMLLLIFCALKNRSRQKDESRKIHPISIDPAGMLDSSRGRQDDQRRGSSSPRRSADLSEQGVAVCVRSSGGDRQVTLSVEYMVAM
jgi:hypothetical protein